MGRTEVDAALLHDTFNMLIGYAVGKNVSPPDAEELASGAVAALTEVWNEGLVDASNIKALAIRQINGSISNHIRKEAGRKTIEASAPADLFNRTTESDFAINLIDRMAIQYDHLRLHSSLGYLTPVEFNEAWNHQHQQRLLLAMAH